MKNAVSKRFTLKILIGMALGIALGLLFKQVGVDNPWRVFIINEVMGTGGAIFLNLIKMLVVPIVFVSVVCGSAGLGDLRQLGRVGIKSLFFYLLTTVIAITLAIMAALFFKVGQGMQLAHQLSFTLPKVVPFKDVLINLFPTNPIRALSEGSMLQIIVFAILLGIACAVSGDQGKKVMRGFEAFNQVMMKLITMIMNLAPIGVLCLLAVQFSHLHPSAVIQVVGYFLTVLAVLVVQAVVVYSVMLMVLARLNPIVFFKKMYAAMLFAFSVSSSNASIPIVLRTVEEKLGVDNQIASFVIPLGATINMDGTAIMQGVATVFIAHLFQVHLGITGYVTVIGMATMASIGTAGVPGVGLLTLAMVLQQVGIPVEGIAMIIGVDRLLDMVRTAVNISGDSMIACLVAKSERLLDQQRFSTLPQQTLKK